MTDLAFLFGAGASKAAHGWVKPYAPPLMHQLFDELARAFPREWGPGSTYEKYSDQFRKNFEQTFTEVVLGNDFQPSPALTLLEGQRPLALYFSRFVLNNTGADCYSKLLASLGAAGKISHAVFGSLNYECLFEQAAHDLLRMINYSYTIQTVPLASRTPRPAPGVAACGGALVGRSG